MFCNNNKGLILLNKNNEIETANLVNKGKNQIDESILLQPFEYIRSIPGKQIRTKILRSFNHWLQVPEKINNKIIEIIENLHNASLMIDDIEDGSELRRGNATSHIVFGIPQTINAANYVYFTTLENVLALNHPMAVYIFCEQMLEAHRGQGLDIYWRDNFYCPTKEQYNDLVDKKTGCLFKFSIQLLQLFSHDQRCYKRIIYLFGLFFQIRDDYANLTDPKYFKDKTFCEDLTEGKFSFPVIHAIRNGTKEAKAEIDEMLKRRTTNVDLKMKFLSLLEQSGSIEYTKMTVNEIEMDIRKEVKLLGKNQMLELILDQLSLQKNSN